MNQEKLAKLQAQVRIGGKVSDQISPGSLTLFSAARPVVSGVSSCFLKICSCSTARNALSSEHRFSFRDKFPKPPQFEQYHRGSLTKKTRHDGIGGDAWLDGETGGWHRCLRWTSPQGSARRKKKVVHRTATADDKKLQFSLKKLGVNNISGIEEVCVNFALFQHCLFCCSAVFVKPCSLPG